MVNFFTPLGTIDLSLIKDEDVEAMSDPQKEALAVFIDTVTTKTEAAERLKSARDRVRAATIAEQEAFAQHQAANPPPSRIEAMRAVQAAFSKSHA